MSLLHETEKKEINSLNVGDVEVLQIGLRANYVVATLGKISVYLSIPH